MPRYAKFMVEMITKKIALDYETVGVPHSFITIMTKELRTN